MRALAIVLALAGVAGADPLVGLRLGLGRLPIDGAPSDAVSIGLGVEHPVLCQWRAFGEYEWLWLQRVHGTEPEPHGDGHRIQIGVRHRLAVHRVSGDFALFVDGELGGGLALVSDQMTGVRVIPDALAGVRLGYDLRAPASPSTVFEAELLVRVLAIPGGAGAMLGVGMLWN